MGARLPYLTAEQSKNLSGSFDFVGFNHYLVVRAQSDERAFDRKQRDYYNDAAAIASKCANQAAAVPIQICAPNEALL